MMASNLGDIEVGACSPALPANLDGRATSILLPRACPTPPTEDEQEEMALEKRTKVLLPYYVGYAQQCECIAEAGGGFGEKAKLDRPRHAGPSQRVLGACIYTDKYV